MINKKMMKRLSAFALSAILCLSACPSNVVYGAEVTENTEAVVTEETTEVSEVEAVAETTETSETDALADETEVKNDDAGIPDATLYQYLLKKYGGEDGKLTYGELKEMYSFFYEVTEEQPAIASFKNLSLYAPNLYAFTYGINNVTVDERVSFTITDMQEMKALQENAAISNDSFSLSLWGIEMNKETADVIGEMTNLRGLELSNCTISSYDFLTSKNLASLTSLDLGFNDLESIPDITHMTALTDLYLRDNNLTDLPDLTGLESLDLNENNTDNLWENYLSKEVLIARLPKHVTDNTAIIDDIFDRQDKELECDLVVDIEGSEITPGTTIPMTLTVKNTGVDLENVLVFLRASNSTGDELYVAPTGYTLEGNNIRIPALKHNETLTLKYEVTTGEDGQWKDYAVTFDAKVWYEADEWVNDQADSYETNGWIYIWEEDNSGSGSDSGSDDYVEPETLDLKVTDVTVSNSNIVVNNDAPSAKVDISITVEGADMDKLQDGYYASVNLLNKDKQEEGYFAFNVNYNAETKKFEGTTYVQGANIADGQYVMVGMDYSGNYGWSEITVEKEFPMWTYTNNNTDKTAPKLNGVQVIINGVTQTGTSFNLKQGDTIAIRADITDDSSLTGAVMIYPTTWDNLSTSQYMEMNNAGNLQYMMRATEYDLECEKTLNAPFYEGEYQIYYVIIQDGCANSSYYYTEDLAPLMKEVAKNPSNAGLVENEALSTELKKVADSVSTLVSKDGAMDAATKARVEAAIAAGDTVSAELTISNVPASSVNSKVKEDVQKKADEVFGEDTKLLYLDINMNLVGSKMGNLGQLNELGEEISITVTLPEELQGDYDYKIVRYHEKADGTVETTILDAVKNADGTLTFKTDRFSTYAVAYGKIITENETVESTKPTSPNTGDMNMTLMYLGLAVIAMTVVGVSRKGRKAV